MHKVLWNNWEQGPDSHWVCKGSMGVDGFRRFSTVFDGFRRFSIVFNGLSLHEVNTQGLMWSVIGEVFFFFSFNIILLLFSFLVCIPKTNYWFAWGYWGLPPYPNSVKDMHPELCGGCHRRWCGGHHGTWVRE